jgi:hypothetical protein
MNEAAHQKAPTTIRRWHEIVAARDGAGLDELIADDATFYSPIVHTPQRGKGAVKLYLNAALATFGGEHFHYVGEWFGANSAALEFMTRIDEIEIDGVDLIGWNEFGKIVSFKVMIRPLKAIQVVHQKMGAMLTAMQQQQQ